MSKLLASAAIVPLMWFSLMPSGAEFCQSGKQFVGSLGDQGIGVTAESKAATLQFCKVVASTPRA